MARWEPLRTWLRSTQSITALLSLTSKTEWRRSANANLYKLQSQRWYDHTWHVQCDTEYVFSICGYPLCTDFVLIKMMWRKPLEMCFSFKSSNMCVSLGWHVTILSISFIKIFMFWNADSLRCCHSLICLCAFQEKVDLVTTSLQLRSQIQVTDSYSPYWFWPYCMFTLWEEGFPQPWSCRHQSCYEPDHSPVIMAL